MHRGVAHDVADPFLGEQLAILFGREEARKDGIHTDVVRRPLARQVLRNLIDSAFRHRVREYLRQRGDRKMLTKC